MVPINLLIKICWSLRKRQNPPAFYELPVEIAKHGLPGHKEWLAEYLDIHGMRSRVVFDRFWPGLRELELESELVESESVEVGCFSRSRGRGHSR